ncbi:MAG: nidogen-like domain-containing protein [Candidatus Binatia bacterium]
MTRALALTVLISCLLPLGVAPGAVRTLPGFTTNTLAANDDDSTAEVPIGFPINFFGHDYSGLYVNNNGNVTFDEALADFTPFNLTQTARVIIAPFFADVDTRGEESSVVRYGNDTVDGHPAFGVNWVGVGYYDGHSDELNAFQLVLIDRSDVAPKAFDVEFNYDHILWDLTDSSEGQEPGPRAGFSNGGDQALELDGSGESGVWLDSSPTGLVHASRDSTEPGRYLFAVRNGAVTCKRDKECNDRVSCTSNACRPGDPAADALGCVFTSTCVSSDVCQTSTCDVAQNACVSTPKPNEPPISCDNGNRCGLDVCDAGTCVDQDACQNVTTPDQTPPGKPVIPVTCGSDDGTADKGDYCEAVGVVTGLSHALARAAAVSDGTVITKRIRKKLNLKTGRAVLRLQLNKAGKKLLKTTSPLHVNVEVTVASHGDTSLLSRLVDVVRAGK